MKENKYVDMEYVRNNPNETWNLFHLSQNKQLTVKDVETLILPKSKGKWNWYYISQNINIKEVRDNPNKPWDKHGLSYNSQLTMEDIDTFILPNNKESWYYITESINIWEVINNPSKPWDKYGLINNKQCTSKLLEFFNAGLLKHLQKNIPKFQYHTDIVINCEY